MLFPFEGETGECFVWKCCIHEETNIWKVLFDITLVVVEYYFLSFALFFQEQLHQEVIAHKGSIACISAHPLNPIVCVSAVFLLFTCRSIYCFITITLRKSVILGVFDLS